MDNVASNGPTPYMVNQVMREADVDEETAREALAIHPSPRRAAAVLNRDRDRQQKRDLLDNLKAKSLVQLQTAKGEPIREVFLTDATAQEMRDRINSENGTHTVFYDVIAGVDRCVPIASVLMTTEINADIDRVIDNLDLPPEVMELG